jgi:hypothetical protein
LPLDGAPPILKGRFYDKYKHDFAEPLDAYAATVDFPIAVVTLPTLPNNSMLKALYKPLSKIFSSCSNIHFYDTLTDFNAFASFKHRSNYSVNEADFHPGSANHKFYSDFIKSFIENDFPYLLDLYKDYDKQENEININEFLPYNIHLKKLSDTDLNATYSFTYPDKNETNSFYDIDISQYYLTQPINKHHIKLSFSDSVKISEIKVQGQYDDLQLYYTCIDKKLNYDNHKVYEFTSDKNGGFYGCDGKEITSILVSAVFTDGKDRNLTVTFSKG